MDINMALIKCPDCQNEISKSATSCPKCGKPLKKKSSGLGCLVALILSALVVLGIYETSSKPELRAKVSIGPNSIMIINGNDKSWSKTTIKLNSAFGGPMLEINGEWNPNERKEFDYSQFRGQFNNQSFSPDFDKVKKVVIDVDGFQAGIYK